MIIDVLAKPQLTEPRVLASTRFDHFDNFLLFIRTFFKLRTGRDFELSCPPSRPSHYTTIAEALHGVLIGKTKRLIINVPPRYGKTEMVIHFVAWALARYPASNFLYISYAHNLAARQTQYIRDIISLSQYKSLFGIALRSDSQAKDYFITTDGGTVYAAGAGGTITGFGAGIKGCTDFGGGIIIDDIHKPDEVTSDTIREGTIEWYYNTLQSRLNDPSTPIIFIGQRLHEHDLVAELMEKDTWETVILPAIDAAGNPLHPKMHTLEQLRKMQELSPYNFASQYQQNPQPSGGGIFKRDWFMTHEFEPKILDTFITIDTAETDKTYNDATVFSFWGVYRIVQNHIETDDLALHWINCVEIRIEPKDLHQEFIQFYHICLMHKVRPKIIAIEKKSTGVTLASMLKDLQGVTILDIERTKASGNKTARYLEIQPYVSSKQITLPANGSHTSRCIDHMCKITANNTHRHDDIADTAYDAVKLGLIDKIIYDSKTQVDYENIARLITSGEKITQELRRSAFRR